MRGADAAEGDWSAWLMLGAVPLAGVCLFFSSGWSALDDVLRFRQGGVVVAAGVVASSVSVLLATHRWRAVALLPFLLPHGIALFATDAALDEIFVASTHTSPATIEQIVAGSIADAMRFRSLPLWISTAAVVLDTLALVVVSRRWSPRARAASLLAHTSLASGMLVLSLSVEFIRRHVELLPDLTISRDPAWLARVARLHGDYASSSNTLLIAAIVLGLAAFAGFALTGRSLTGVATLVALTSTVVGFRGAVLLDEHLLVSHFHEFPIFLGMRIDDPPFPVVRLFGGRSLNGVARDLEDVSHAPRVGLATWTDERLWGPVTDRELQQAIWRARSVNLTSLELVAPIAPFPSTSAALRPLVEFHDSLITTVPFAVQFADEPARDQCEAMGLDEVSNDELLARGLAAVARGHQLVVVVPRTKE